MGVFSLTSLSSLRHARFVSGSISSLHSGLSPYFNAIRPLRHNACRRLRTGLKVFSRREHSVSDIFLRIGPSRRRQTEALLEVKPICGCLIPVLLLTSASPNPLLPDPEVR